MLTFPLGNLITRKCRLTWFILPRYLFFTLPTTKDNVGPKSPLFISPLYQFFEDGVPVPDANSEKFHTFGRFGMVILGRSWSAAELRLKSFDDLHKLWFVCLKELNVLSTQETFAKRRHVEWNGASRILKVSITFIDVSRPN